MLSLSYRLYQAEPVFSAKITNDTFAIALEVLDLSLPPALPFLFSPEQEDDNIGTDQFKKEYPTVEEMQDYGIKISLIRQEQLEKGLAEEKKLENTT